MKLKNPNQQTIVTAAIATVAAAVTVTLWASRTTTGTTTTATGKNSNRRGCGHFILRFLKIFSFDTTAANNSTANYTTSTDTNTDTDTDTDTHQNHKDSPLQKTQKGSRKNNCITIQIQWPTLVALYALMQFKPKHAASLALPLLYFLCLDRYDHDDDDKKKKKKTTDQGYDHDDTNTSHNKNDGNSSSSSYTTSKQQQERQYYNDSSSRPRSTSVESQPSGSVECSSSSIHSGGGSGGSLLLLRQQRYVEMLVHNVSHTDLVLCLGIPPQHHDSEGDTTCSASSEAEKMGEDDKVEMTLQLEQAHALCRPRFSAFDMFCQRILRVLETCNSSSSSSSSSSSTTTTGTLQVSLQPPPQEGQEQQQQTQQQQQQQQRLYSSIMSFPRYERSDSCTRFSLVTPKASRRSMLPVGFNLSQLVQDCSGNITATSTNDDSNSNNMTTARESLELDSDDLMNLRVRGRDLFKMEGIFGPGGYWSLASSPKRIGNAQVPSSDIDNEEVEIGKSDADANADVDANSKTDTKNGGLHLEAVFFPLLSSLLRRWHKQIADKYGPVKVNNVKKVLILVSGVGTPRNWTHSKSGNSTEACAKLMEIFIKVLYPDVVVVRLHSEREIFRYDENIAFANKELLPCIDAYRDAHARGEAYPDEVGRQGICKSEVSSKTFNTEWKQTFALTLSFADGAPARTHAIQSSLRPYRPTYFHFWQLKTFWHDSKICDDDIEVHSFESMETVPPMEVCKTNSDVQLVVEEMKRFRLDFLRAFQRENTDIESFWLRKTKKPVLAILLVNLPGKGVTMYRGTNMEVSMPTGSLCAERNVIGTALATNPGLRREDLMMVAVLAVPLPKEQLSSETPPQIPTPPMVMTSNTCTNHPPRNDQSAIESTFFFSEVERKLSKYQRPENCRRSMSIGSFASIVEDGESNNSDDSSWENMSTSNEPNSVEESPSRVAKPSRKLSASELDNTSLFMDSEASTPVRKIKLYDDADIHETVKDDARARKHRRKKGRTVIVHSSEDINPLKPCGACNEWLKKIAESNPYFKVITFTDTDCNGVYVTSCQE